MARRIANGLLTRPYVTNDSYAVTIARVHPSCKCDERAFTVDRLSIRFGLDLQRVPFMKTLGNHNLRVPRKALFGIITVISYLPRVSSHKDVGFPAAVSCYVAGVLRTMLLEWYVQFRWESRYNNLKDIKISWRDYHAYDLSTCADASPLAFDWNLVMGPVIDLVLIDGSFNYKDFCNVLHSFLSPVQDSYEV